MGTSLLYKFFLHTSHFDERVADGLDSFAPDSASIASSIKYHSEFTPLFSPGRFELPKAYLATAQSVQDMLIINWNATYDYYEKMNVKQAYYLSMEYLQVRSRGFLHVPIIQSYFCLTHYFVASIILTCVIILTG